VRRSTGRGLRARIVHGGRRVAPARLDAATEAEIAGLARFAPLHNRVELACVRAMRARLPEQPQIAVFDTAFHAARAPESLRYALPWPLADELGLFRYGFHGIAHESLLRALARARAAEPEAQDAVTLQLGAGCSACAIRAGRSLETSMGCTPLEGLVMATRSGDVDPGVVLALLRSGRGPTRWSSCWRGSRAARARRLRGHARGAPGRGGGLERARRASRCSCADRRDLRRVPDAARERARSSSAAASARARRRSARAPPTACAPGTSRSTRAQPKRGAGRISAAGARVYFFPTDEGRCSRARRRGCSRPRRDPPAAARRQPARPAIAAEEAHCRESVPEFARWAAGYGPIVHEDLTQWRMYRAIDRLARAGIRGDGANPWRLLHAADRLAAASLWLAAHQVYATEVRLDGRDLESTSFKREPEGHLGGSLNMAIAYVGYLAANALTATRARGSWAVTAWAASTARTCWSETSRPRTRRATRCRTKGSPVSCATSTATRWTRTAVRPPRWAAT
jgi:hypothetical protein